MPRLPPSLIHSLLRNYRTPLLPLILRETRDVPSAINELRWLRGKVDEVLPPVQPKSVSISNSGEWLREMWDKRRREIQREQLLRRYVVRRGVWGEPLQYILGTEYFGETGVEVKCKKGVLVPRPETADLITHFIRLYQHNHPLYERKCEQVEDDTEGLNIIDICTGTGCIPLLMHSLLYPPCTSSPTTPPKPKILGLDISPTAISLARHNLFINALPKSQGGKIQSIHSCALEGENMNSSPGGVHFLRGDVWELVNTESPLTGEIRDFFAHERSGEYGRRARRIDVVVSNPPYISPREYLTSTARSVRKWEPEIALVPPPPPSTSMQVKRGDEFYPLLSHLAYHVFRANVLLVEVGGDEGQAERVEEIFRRGWSAGGDGAGGVAVWRDFGGRRRGVIAWRERDGWGSWLGEDMLRD